MGLGDKAFTYNVLLQGLSLFGCIVTIFFLDKVGRRPILIIGTFLQIPFMLLVAGLGTKANKTATDYNGMVASILLFNLAVKVSLSTNAYLIASEIGGTRMRRKSRLSRIRPSHAGGRF
jgi:SP family sugar:H+ symporter-like MFS transporter